MTLEQLQTKLATTLKLPCVLEGNDIVVRSPAGHDLVRIRCGNIYMNAYVISDLVEEAYNEYRA